MLASHRGAVGRGAVRENAGATDQECAPRVASLTPVTAGEAKATYPRHNWLAAVIPADARRFRVADDTLAATLAEAGAELVDSDADVEIAPARALTGDAPFAVVSLDHILPEGSSRLVQAFRRALGSLRIRVRAHLLRPAVRRRGYPSTTVVPWEWEQVVRLRAMDHRQPMRLAERLPLAALVVGSRRGSTATILEEALSQANEKLGSPLRPGRPLVRQGGLVAIADEGVLRVAVGPASRELGLLRGALDALHRADPPDVVADRVPWILGNGRAGLAEWTVERRLPGSDPAGLTDVLLADCVNFLVALQGAGDREPDRPLVDAARIIGAACPPDEADAVRRIARELDDSLAEVPRGFGHGDFWIRNLLTEGERLVGVVDWHLSGPGRLPLLDLFHLRSSVVFERTRKYLGVVLVEHLLPWAASGGDEIARSYCRRIGLEAGRELLEDLVLAYWLTRTARELEMYADRVERPVWIHHNVIFVARAIAARLPARR
jgi:hypothetical protein